MLILLLSAYLTRRVSAAPLAVFRIFFGGMMCAGIIRFWSKGWIAEFYILPQFFFKYYGFEWVRPLGNYTYLLFALCALFALMLALGYRYRIAAPGFFLTFTYLELMDKTYYLNHYYFISLVAFLLIFLPADAYFSIDARRNPRKAFQTVPAWSIDALKLMLALVYFYAGLAKLNSDWLLRASPLNIWLPVKYDIFLLGFLMDKTWFHFAMSWAGAAYDLSIPFLLFNRRTRWFAFALVVIFHLFTRILFPIGMFPYIMILSSTIFFSPALHHKFLALCASVCRFKKSFFDNGKALPARPHRRAVLILIALFFCLQLLLPWRYCLYPGELFWTEQGYRFSWRVMLVEKAGIADFKIVDKKNGQFFYVDNNEFLTLRQQKQMAFQADFILAYARFLGDTYKKRGIEAPQVFVDNFVTLNGRISAPYIDPEVDLYQKKESFKPKNWIIPFNDKIKIKGL